MESATGSQRAERSETLSVDFCRTMNTSSKIPVAMHIHQVFRLLWKVISVWIKPLLARIRLTSAGHGEWGTSKSCSRSVRWTMPPYWRAGGTVALWLLPPEAVAGAQGL